MARELTTVFRPTRQQGRKTWRQFTKFVLWIEYLGKARE